MSGFIEWTQVGCNFGDGQSNLASYHFRINLAEFELNFNQNTTSSILAKKKLGNIIKK